MFFSLNPALSGAGFKEPKVQGCKISAENYFRFVTKNKISYTLSLLRNFSFFTSLNNFPGASFLMPDIYFILNLFDAVFKNS